MMLTQDEAKEYCKLLLGQFKSNLSPWEDTFVRDLSIRFTQGNYLLSEKQSAILDRIMERCAQQYR
jgi:hypothetical protein